MPTTFTFNSNDYSGIISPISQERSYDETGYDPETNFQILAVASQFGTVSNRPAPQDKITVAGTVYRILTVTPDEFDVALLIDLAGIDQA